VDLYSIRNMDNLYSGINCISRSANGIPCMHSALHSSIIAYGLRLKRAKVLYSIRKGLYSEKKVFGSNG